jgi:RNA polymerase sigma factor (sigma-70 family)
MITAAVVITAAMEAATTSAPHESQRPHGRPDDGAAAARTEELYGRYGRTVKGLCGALLRDRSEAEDASQQTFLSAHRALLNGTEPLEPAAWLATIARNECWGRIRTRMREPLPVHEFETASLQPDPLAEAIRRADLAALWVAIEALPRQQRDALLLREFGGLSYGELAEALAVSEPAIESLLFRARHRLRGQLRAAYASLSGASWIDALVRLFAGGGAPVAAKVAALGVGAAAVGSSAVVVPHVLDNHRHVRPAVTMPARVHPKRQDAVPAPVSTKRVVFEPAKAAPHRVASVVRTVVPSTSQGRDSERHSAGDETKVSSSAAGDVQEVEHAQKRESASNDNGSGSAGGGDEGHTGSSGSSGSSGGGDGSADSHGSGGHGSGDEEPAPPVTTPETPPLLPPTPPEGD